jgi:hypothetical protein
MKHLSYDDGSVCAEIDIRAATTDEGIQRGTVTYDVPKDDKHPFRAHSLFATLSVPSDILKLEVDGKPAKFSIELMRKLPDAFTSLWERRVLEVNPQWRYDLTSDQLEEIQKKATRPSGGSKDSTGQAEKSSKKT